VQDDGYWDKKSLNRSFKLTDDLRRTVKETEGVSAYAPRVDVFALVSSGESTRGAMVRGMEPEHEQAITDLKARMTSGDYLQKGSSGIILAAGLARHLSVGVGDTVVVLGQGYHGATAAGKFPVVGLAEFPATEMNAGLAYITLPEAQEMTWALGRATALAIMVESPDHMSAVQQRLRDKLSDEYDVMNWREMMPELVEAIEADNASGIIMLIVIYLVIAFGIFGTILMMTMERTREFGMMIAVGMKRTRLRGIVVLESVLLNLLGVLAGIVVSVPVLLYLFHHPIRLTGEAATYMESFGFEPVLPFSLAPSIFWWQALTVLIIAVAASVYPVWRIGRIEPVDELRN
jgi:ABC-type lipoprotein release transport system permease subunit